MWLGLRVAGHAHLAQLLLNLNTYNKSEIDTFFTDYYNIEYLNTQFGLKQIV